MDTGILVFPDTWGYPSVSIVRVTEYAAWLPESGLGVTTVEFFKVRSF